MRALLRRWWWTLPLALLFAVAWGPALFGPFQFDDDLVIVHYAPVHTLAGWWAAQPGLRPLLKLSYALNWAFDPSPPGFHLVNLVLHALNGVLALLWLRRVLPPALHGGAALAVAAWLLHPATTEAVTYIAGRSVSLAATFALAALWSAAGDRRGARWQAALFTALALAVRETSWSLPLALLLVEWLRGRAWRAAVRQALPSLLVVPLAAIAMLAEPHHRRLLADALQARDLSTHLLLQLEAYRWLAAQALLLAPPDIDPDFRVPAAAVSALTALALLATLALALAGTWRRRSLAGGGVLLFFLFLVPGNSLLPRLDVANDRHLYLPLLGLALAALAALQAPWQRAVARFGAPAVTRAGVAAGAVLLLSLAAATALRNLDYLDERTLWQRTVEQSPGKSRAWNNLGMACAQAGDLECADDAYAHAIALDPHNARARANRYFLRRPPP